MNVHGYVPLCFYASLCAQGCVPQCLYASLHLFTFEPNTSTATSAMRCVCARGYVHMCLRASLRAWGHGGVRDFSGVSYLCASGACSDGSCFTMMPNYKRRNVGDEVCMRARVGAYVPLCVSSSAHAPLQCSRIGCSAETSNPCGPFAPLYTTLPP